MIKKNQNSKNAKDEWDEEIESKDDKKIDQVPKTYVILKHHWDTINQNLPKNLGTLIRFIAKYRSLNIDKLETPYPIDSPPWVNECNRILYTVTGIDEKAFVDDVLTIRGWDGYVDTYLKDKAPGILLMLIARWLIMNKKAKELSIIEYYIGYSHYWQVFHRYFKKYKPKLEVMKYTIEEMSYKSRLKALGSVDKWLYDGVMNTLDTYNERLLRGSDFELHYINEKIKSKFSSAMKTIYRAQEKNEKENNYIFTSKGVVDGEMVENTYGSADVLVLADAYATKFFEDPLDESLVDSALIPGGITKRDLTNVILMISDNKDNLGDVKKLYQSLFHLFLENGRYTPKDIGSTRFYYEMDKLYRPGNSNDPNKLFIKEVLDKWLAMGSKTFRNTNRTPTITTFRKSIYTYFILKIMHDH